MNNTYKTNKTDWRRLGRSILFVALLLGASLPARATDYVFIYNNNYLAVGENGAITYTPTFSPQCVWTCISNTGNMTENSLQNSNTLYWLTTLDANGTRRWLQANASNGASITTSTSAGTAYWRRDNNSRLIYRRSNTTYYAYLRNNTWMVSSTAGYNNNNSSYQGGGWSYTDYRSTYYEVTTTSQGPTDNTTVNISISGQDGNTITFAHEDLGGTFVPEYTRYVFNGGTHNWYNNTDYGSTVPSVNANTLSPQYAWSLTANGGGVASISSSTGVLTIDGDPTGNITVRLTVSNISPLSNKTATDFTLTRAAIAQNVTENTTLTTPTMSPTSATLYYNEGNQEFTSLATATKTTTTIPAHTTLTGGGNTYYYYDGTLYSSTAGFSTAVETHPDVTLTWALSGAAASYLTRTPATGASTTVTHTSQSPSDLTATLTVTASATDATPKTATATITAYGPMVAPTITRTGNTITLATTSTGATIYYTTDGTTPTAESTAYTGPFPLTTSPTTVKAIAIRDVHTSAVTTSEAFQITLPDPIVSINQSTGAVTITPGEGSPDGVTFRYNKGDSPADPTEETTNTGTSTSLNNMQTIKVIATKTGYTSSNVVTALYVNAGLHDGMVILDDREDHSWSYYSDPECPVRSLNPADVKITYYGDGIVMTGNADYTASSTDFVKPGQTNYTGGAKVNVGGEDENTFVYYKTLERGANTTTAWTFSSGNQSSAASRCPYTTIPNPFQVRPTYGARGSTDANNFTGWRGFQCWRLKSVSGGAVYSAASGGTALAVGAIINGETDIYFAPNSEYDMAVELEAVWARAYLIKGNQSEANTILSQNVGVERNFMTLTTNENYRFNGTSGRRITNIGYPVTISCYYPSGEAPDNTNGVVTGNNNNITLGADTKFENVTLSAGSYTLTTSGYDVIIGRGCTSTNVGTVRGMSDGSTSAVNYTIRLESGTYGTFALIDNTARTFSSTVSTRAVFGSDYDRAKSDNSKLSIAANSTVYGGDAVHVFSSASNRNNLTYDWLIKSGRIQGSKSVTDANADESIYIGNSGNNDNTQYMGKRRFTMEGGEIASLAGSLNSYGNNRNTYMVNDGDAVEIRVKGGTIRGSVYGAAAYASATGNRRFIFTGGEVGGWIAGGANGTQSDGGYLYGSTKIYIGGETSVNSNSSTSVINRAVGGNVFGAGCGYGASSNSGQVTEGTTVVVADEAYVERGVYGGGSYGYTTNTSNVYILGGHVEGKNGGVNGTTYSANIAGGVYGGACQNQGGTVNITMTGGLVEGGLYGGSNTTGTISNNVTMQIDGGQVGTPSQHANIHGGGFGQATRVSRNVELTLGSGCDATDGVTVYGDVYGGSALGYVNGTSATNTYHTYVSLYKGTIYGGLYGGGLGNSTVAANVYGPVQVKVYGGSVRPNDGTGENGSGGVFGCNNVNGTPAGTVTVDLYGTDPAEAGQEFALYAVYGGGNRSDYTGTPVVTIHGCDNNIEYVYGGGNASDVAGTNVTIWGGHIGNAFGGGNGFSTTGNHTNASADHYNPGANITSGGTNLTIHGGTIDAAFGGSNQYGTINGGITVTVVEGTESGTDPCSGAAYTACSNNTITELYGGGNEAPVQTSGGTYITPSVTISSCDMEITNLFGGAKKADYEGNISLEITKGKFQNVFGGNNLGGTITGNVTLTLKGGTMINAFGGNNQGGSITGTITVIVDSTGNDCPLKVENVYGGGNEAAYEPSDNTITSPVVNVVNGTVRNAVFGGGLGAAAGVTANPQVTIGGTGSKHAIVGGRLIDDSDDGDGNVYGGGSQADVLSTSANNGNTHVILTGNARVKGNVYGGGNQADVEGNTKVEMR